MCRFKNASQFIRCYHCNILAATTANEDNLAIFYNFVN